MNGMPGRHRAIPEPYVVVSIARSKPPEGASGENWYTYVIEQGDNVIRGHRQGTCASVAEFVDHSVGLLNERRLGKPGRTHLRLNSSKKG